MSLGGRLARRAVLAAILLGPLVALGAGAWTWRQLTAPWAGWTGEHVDVVLEPGTSAGRMLDDLAAAGVVRRPGLVRRWLAVAGGADALHAGEYRFEEPASALEVLERLRRGDVLLHAVTVPEGLVLGEVVARFAEAGFGTPDELAAVFGDPAPVRDLDPAAPDLEGYLFPETYRFARGTPPRTIAEAMVTRFRETTGAEWRERAREVGLEVREAVTLASLIEEETSVPEERRRISRVFHNRLDRGMKLQCDPTVRYALERAGRPVERLTYDHLTFESPFNTYVVRGLPPGPIASPGAASLEAAVDPATGDELYFVAAPGGGHRFSATLAGHLDAVAAWRAYSRSSSR